MTDYMRPDVGSDLIRIILTTFLDRPAYLVLGLVYQIFFNVATAELFSNAMIRQFYFRCQMVIGIFMLFKFSVTILEGIVDPARVTDKKNGASKIISRIISSLVILVLITPINIPSPRNEWEKQLNNNGIIFGALYSLQGRILKDNTIGKLVLGTSDETKNTETQGESLSSSANRFTSSILRGFFRINIKSKSSSDYDDTPEKNGKDPESSKKNWVCQNIEDDVLDIYYNGSPGEILTLVNYDCSQAAGKGLISSTIKKITGTADYAFAYSFIGAIGAWVISIVLIGYTVDIAIRAIKLAVLRLIAPIPIISHMHISSKESKGADSFSLWTKSIISTYVDLFIRLAVLYFAIYLVQDMLQNGIVIKVGTGLVGAISFLFIALGIFLFARQAPKFITDVLGIQGSGSNIGLASIMSAAGTLRAGGSLHDAFNSVRETADNSINAINSGKAPPGVFASYNAGRDLAARVLTGNEKATWQAMRRGRSELSREGITTSVVGDYKADMLKQQGILKALEDAREFGPDGQGNYNFRYTDADGTLHTHTFTASELNDALAEQRTKAAKAESRYNDMTAEQKRHFQQTSYHADSRGARNPYSSIRSQRRNAAHGRTPAMDNLHDNRAADYNTDNGINRQSDAPWY